MKIHAAAFLALLSLPAVSGKDDVQGRNLRQKLTVEQAPPLPGVAQRECPKVILAQALDYPPFTSIGEDLSISGFGPDFARGLTKVCDIEIELAETDWNECWTSEGTIGRGLTEGTYHGCTTYTGTAGVRQRFLEFSAPITSMNKVSCCCRCCRCCCRWCCSMFDVRCSNDTCKKNRWSKMNRSINQSSF